jgi:hypothetical protein
LTDRGRLRERRLWIAVTAALAGTLAGLAALSLVLVVNLYGDRFPEVFIVLRTLTHVALALGRSGGLAAAGALVAAGLLLALALRSGTRPERQARHA